MTQDNTLSRKLSNSKLNKLKSGVKIGVEVTLNLSSNGLTIIMMRLIFHIDYY